ncbi:GNAT family N-acetyltransferase [Roseomonas elaeocarpi]|uniref:GNAT family N-acetyltransferase n=1 Tax=Roseomonas elaeocarpi TaxID=907779 RepID=A0ABV6JX79_9PROT
MPDAVLILPCPAALPAFRAALERGWSPTTVRAEPARQALLRRLAEDAEAVLREMEDPDGSGPPVVLPDGTAVPRLPGITRWIWDAAAGEDGFCGTISLRWQAGTEVLPPHVLGHVGYVLVPERRGLGHATVALRALLPEARRRGLRWVELVTDPGNLASQRVIGRCGGILVERFRKTASHGGAEALRFRIPTPALPPS